LQNIVPGLSIDDIIATSSVTVLVDTDVTLTFVITGITWKGRTEVGVAVGLRVGATDGTPVWFAVLYDVLGAGKLLIVLMGPVTAYFAT
jgi:hypothetical protein